MRKSNQYQNNILFLIILFFIFFSWFSVLLGNRPLATPDEGRYIEIPREMLASGDYITPRLNGVKYFEKPPLMYWLEALSLSFFGLKEGLLRLCITFFAAVSCIAVTAFSWRFFNKTIGILSGVVLATAPLYYILARLIILDMPVTSLMTIAMVCFLATVHTLPGLSRRLYAYGFYAACALGILTKGIMVTGIMGPIILLWALIDNRWKDLWPAYLPTGLLLFFLIAAPWHILVSLQNPEFLYKYFVVEHFMRYTTSIHLRSKPFWFFAPIVFIGFFPWIMMMKQMITVRSSLTPPQRSIILFLWIWIVFIFTFFSIGNSKLIPYILPIFPAFSIIAAVTLHHIRATQSRILFLPATGIVSILIAIIGWIVLHEVPDLIQDKEVLLPYIYALIGLFGGGGLVCLGMSRVASTDYRLACLPLFSMGIIAILISSGPHMQRTSLKPITDYLLQVKKPGDRIVSYLFYPQDLPPYLNQTITVIEGKGELKFGTEVEDTSSWMMSLPQFKSLWSGSQPLLVVLYTRDLERWVQTMPNSPYVILYKYDKYSVITNHPR